MLLERIEAPARTEVSALAKKIQKLAKKAGIQPDDVEKANRQERRRN